MNVFAASSLRGFCARRIAAWFAYANLLILWDVHFVCALFETVVASQVSPPVGEQGKQDFTWRPSAERLPVEAGRSRAGPDLKENGASLYGRDPTKGFADATTTLASARAAVAEAVAWPVAGNQAQRGGVCAM